MRVASLAIDPFTTLPIVVLEDDGGTVTVPIRVGAGDASAIAAELEQIDFTWPTTHRLMSDLLDGAGVRVRSVDIDASDDGSFFGAIQLELPSGERVRQESRPSDALALALRTGAELRVARGVVESAAREAIAEAPTLAAMSDANPERAPEIAPEMSLDPSPADEGASRADRTGDLLSTCRISKWKM